MFKAISLAGAALAMGATAFVPTMAEARYYNGHPNRGYVQRDGYYQGDYNRYRTNRYNYRAQQRCADGDGGTIVGAIAGGLLGRTIDTRGDRLLGTVLGAGAGALAGRAIDRSDRPNYCRR